MNSDKLLDLISYTKKLKVLYTEDNTEVQLQTKKMLNSFFKEIILASNGQEAIDLFLSETFDLVITDIKMPIVDGLALIEFIRKSNKKIPILVFSAHDDKDFFLKSINEGVDGYILKPYTISQITQSILKIIEKYDLLKDENTIYLEDDFSWDKKSNKLFKDGKHIKLTRNETLFFDLFISSKSETISYEDVENQIFHNYNNEDCTKKIRNLITRLRIKLNYDLFETIYSYGYMLKYKKED